jgi:hypothetical protein
MPPDYGALSRAWKEYLMRKMSCGKVLSLLTLALAYALVTPPTHASSFLPMSTSADLPSICHPAAGMPAPAPMTTIQPGQRPPAPGDPGSGGGSCGSTTCAVQCTDGSWSSIACNSNEYATCSCDGSPLLANPYCTAC